MTSTGRIFTIDHSQFYLAVSPVKRRSAADGFQRGFPFGTWNYTFTSVKCIHSHRAFVSSSNILTPRTDSLRTPFKLFLHCIKPPDAVYALHYRCIMSANIINCTAYKLHYMVLQRNKIERIKNANRQSGRCATRFGKG